MREEQIQSGKQLKQPSQMQTSEIGKFPLDVTKWSKDQVCTWIRSVLEDKEAQDQICALFLKNDVNGKILLRITDKNLKEDFGIQSFGIRQTLLDGISQLKQKPGKSLISFPNLIFLHVCMD